MTRRGCKEASEKRRGIKGDERQPVMTQLNARWRRSNLVILVTLKKENHPGEAHVKTSRRKALYRTKRDSLEGPHEEPKIQSKALRPGKNLVLSQETYLEKEEVRSKVTPRNVEVGLKQRWELSKRRLGSRLSWWGSTEKKEISHLFGLRGKHHNLQ